MEHFSIHGGRLNVRSLLQWPDDRVLYVYDSRRREHVEQRPPRFDHPMRQNDGANQRSPRSYIRSCRNRIDAVYEPCVWNRVSRDGDRWMVLRHVRPPSMPVGQRRMRFARLGGPTGFAISVVFLLLAAGYWINATHPGSGSSTFYFAIINTVLGLAYAAIWWATRRNDRRPH
jgi:hypothetical protein